MAASLPVFDARGDDRSLVVSIGRFVRYRSRWASNAADPHHCIATAEASMMDGSTLAAVTDDQYERIDPAMWDDIWVVGDVHGCATELERLLDRIAPSEDDLVVFVGDLVRKGPDSAVVCELVRDRPNLRSICGNNEQKLLRGDATLPDLPADAETYLTTLPIAIALGDALVVHGGLDHRKPFPENTVEELLTTRSLSPGGSYDRPFWFEARTSGPLVYFGHTVLTEAFTSPWAVGLDTGCVYGGQLTAINHATGELVTVESTETYQERAADSIVEPRPPSTESTR